jgi:preprotein translocase subunit YajC
MLSTHAAQALLAASSGSKTTTSGSSAFSLLFLVVIFGVGYMFFIRPRSQQARRQRDTLMELSAGDEVLTGAGIFGMVLDVEADRVTLETAPGTRITVLRSTIARRIPDPAVETPSWDEHDEDEAHGAYHEYEHTHTDDEHDETDDHDVAGAGGADDSHDETEAHATGDTDTGDTDTGDTEAGEHDGDAEGPDDTPMDGAGDKKKR